MISLLPISMLIVLVASLIFLLQPSHAFLSSASHQTSCATAYCFHHRTSPRRLQSSENDMEEAESISSGEATPLEKHQSPKPASPPPSQQDPSPEQIMAAMGTSPRRILLSVASASGTALAANFLGITSRLLDSVPESTVEASGLDTYFPRGEYKRFRGKGYTFVIPKEWVADTAVELAKAQRQAGTLDYKMGRGREAGVLPDAAFGPPGRLDSRGASKGDTNVSVVISKVRPGFSLRGNLGTPTNAAETFIRLSLAPEGSGRTATLVNAEEDVERQVYQFEYDVDRGERGPPLKAISLIAVQNSDNLLTLTVVAPKQEWGTESEAKLRKVASSFHLT